MTARDIENGAKTAGSHPATPNQPLFRLAWDRPGLEMPTEEDNGEGGVNRAPEGSGKARRRARRSRPAGHPCMRRFIPGWKVLGYARRFSSGIVNYADDFRLPGKAPAAVRRIMERPGRRSTRGKPDACGVPKRPRVSGIPRGTQPSPGRRSLHRHPTGQGERQGHPPQGQRANRRKTPGDDTRGHGGAPDRMLSGRQTTITSDRSARHTLR